MTGEGDTISIFTADDGLLLFGSDAALAELDTDPDLVSRRISSQSLARVGGIAGAVAGLAMEQSGRWVKLTKESAVARKGAAQAGLDIGSGVLRGENGQILKHLKFDDLGKGAVLTPAAPAVLGAMATQYALEAALDEITAYLEEIDAKLDRLLKQRKTEMLGQIGGVTLALDEAAAIYAETGTVSEVTWSKVQSTSLALQSMQAEAVAQLNVVAEDVSRSPGDLDKTAKTLGRAQEDAQFWLGVLARTIKLQDRQYLVELARVADVDADQLEAHRRGITVARADRVRRIVAALEAVTDAVGAASVLTNAAKVTNPITAPKVVRRTNALRSDIAEFARRADLDVRVSGAAESTPWVLAARGLLGDATDVAGRVGAGVVDRARAVGGAVEEKRDEQVLRLARRIEEKRQASSSSADDATE